MSAIDIFFGVVLLLASIAICYSVAAQEHDQHRGGVSGQGMAVRKKRIMTEKDGLNLIVRVSGLVGIVVLILYFIMH